jgi:hypothetical protein
MSLSEFAGRGDGETELAARAALIGSALQSGGLGALEIVLGAGLVWAGERLRPMVIVTQECVGFGDGLRPLREVEPAWNIVRDALGSGPAWLDDTYAFVMPSPEPHLQPGDPITSPPIGTVGCRVSWSGGSGFLTAGHVAPTVGSGVFDGRTRLGTVKASSNPAGSGTATRADVAIVELSAGLSFTSSFQGAAAAGPNAPIKVANSGAGSGRIMGFCNFVYWPKINGTYGDTYLTTAAVSTGGDSGSAVIDANNKVVGLIVGGAQSTKGGVRFAITSFIQDVRYQLAQASPGGSGLSGLSI